MKSETYHRLTYIANSNKQTITYIKEAIDQLDSDPRLITMRQPLSQLLQNIITHIEAPLPRVNAWLQAEE